MSHETLERLRKRKVAQAEQHAGVEDGNVYRLPGDPPKLVRVSVHFYPRQHWIIEDVNPIGGASVKGTGRPLTDDIKAKLEAWL